MSADEVDCSVTVPVTFPAAGLVIAPVGAVVSDTNVTEVPALVFPATSVAVIDVADGVPAVAVQEYAELYGPTPGVLTVAAVCVQLVVVPLNAGNVAEAGPDVEDSSPRPEPRS